MFLSSLFIQQIFIAFLLLSTILQMYLSMRQSRMVLKHFDQVPQDFSQTIGLEDHQKAGRYTLAKQKLARYEIVFQACLLVFFTLGGGLNLLATLSMSWVSGPLTQGVFLILFFMLLNMVLSLPFALYKTFKLEVDFGFNRMTWKTFLSDQIKSLALMLILGVPLLYVVIYLMSVMGSMWWLYVWLVWLVFSLVLMWVFPKWIAPLFNTFHPLDNQDLKARIDDLLVRCGFVSNGIFVMDGSKRSGHGNAYFTGLGKNKRIVFYDTLLESMEDAEVEAILAHELGHFKKKHIVKQMLVTFTLVLGILFVMGQVITWPSFYTGLGVNDVFASYAMALLLFFLVFPVFVFVFTPLGSMMSRKNEYEADRYAAEVSSAEDLISALSKLYKDNAASLVTDTWYSLFYDSHPHALARIDALRQTETK